jgi:hypothetical protein
MHERSVNEIASTSYTCSMLLAGVSIHTIFLANLFIILYMATR